jgi:hypothetical protein
MVVVGGTVVVVVLGGIVVIVGGRVVVVGRGVVVGVLRVGLTCGGELAGDVATGGLFSPASRELPGRDELGVPDDVLPGNGGEVVMVLPTTFVVVVVLLAVAVGAVVAPFTCRSESVGGASVTALAHTAPVTANTATTSATPGYQTPSR